MNSRLDHLLVKIYFQTRSRLQTATTNQRRHPRLANRCRRFPPASRLTCSRSTSQARRQRPRCRRRRGPQPLRPPRRTSPTRRHCSTSSADLRLRRLLRWRLRPRPPTSTRSSHLRSTRSALVSRASRRPPARCLPSRPSRPSATSTCSSSSRTSTCSSTRLRLGSPLRASTRKTSAA